MSSRTGALDQNEQIAYNCIKSSGNMGQYKPSACTRLEHVRLISVRDIGIWIRSIKTETNLPQAVLSKVIRALEKRDLIKTVKSIKVSYRMLPVFSLEMMLILS